MQNNITRRDFLNGSLLSLGSLFLPPLLLGQQLNNVSGNGYYYPPLLNGLRGNNTGAFETAHQLAWLNRQDWGSVTTTGESNYDLIIVGAGISGLSAARFYQQKFGKGKRILILDNHDDFGGHARRNEFHPKQKVRLCYGGSQAMEDPWEYSKIVRNLLKDLGVDLERFEDAYDINFFKRHGLRDVTYFNKKIYGRDSIVNHSLLGNDTLPGLLPGTLSLNQAVKQMPLSAEAKKQLLKIVKNTPTQLHKLSKSQREEMAYFTFLKKYLDVDDPQVLRILRLIGADELAMGADVMSVNEAIVSLMLGVPEEEEEEEEEKLADQYIHHFPDGNASIARLLVRKLIPQVATGKTMEDIVMAKFNYAHLDQSDAQVRLRLNSTVVRVRHEGSRSKSKHVKVTYIKNGKALQVKARHCVLACYNSIIPHLAPELPKKQKAALGNQIKMPLVYTTVMLNNWRSLKKLGIGSAFSPGNLHHSVMANFPVSLGGYQAVESVNEPMALTMTYIPLAKKYGRPPKDQIREGRHKLLTTTFSAFEKEIKTHLNGMLGSGGFDAERDIYAITVNRWAHGYAYGGSDIYDEEDVDDLAEEARKPFDRITIANSDAAATADMGAAVNQGWRAVDEL